MRVSLNWLKDYVNLTLAPRELAHKLAMSGNEVDSLEVIGGKWDNVFVGQVMALDKHPNADRLKLVTIDLGKESITVVTGAPNMEVGQKVPFPRGAAKLIDGP